MVSFLRRCDCQLPLLKLCDVLDVLSPLERKELIRLVLDRAEVGERRIALEIYPTTPQELAMPQSRSRSEAPNWLLG